MLYSLQSSKFKSIILQNLFHFSSTFLSWCRPRSLRHPEPVTEGFGHGVVQDGWLAPSIAPDRSGALWQSSNDFQVGNFSQSLSINPPRQWQRHFCYDGVFFWLDLTSRTASHLQRLWPLRGCRRPDSRSLIIIQVKLKHTAHSALLPFFHTVLSSLQRKDLIASECITVCSLKRWMPFLIVHCRSVWRGTWTGERFPVAQREWCSVDSLLYAAYRGA